MTVEEGKCQPDGLSEGDLKKVRAYEEDRKSRKTLLEQLDRKSGTAPSDRETSAASRPPPLEWHA